MGVVNGATDGTALWKQSHVECRDVYVYRCLGWAPLLVGLNDTANTAAIVFRNWLHTFPP